MKPAKRFQRRLICPRDNSEETRAEKTAVMWGLDGVAGKDLMNCLLEENLEMSCTFPRGDLPDGSYQNSALSSV